jgi:hypothetical protein
MKVPNFASKKPLKTAKNALKIAKIWLFYDQNPHQASEKPKDTPAKTHNPGWDTL